MAEQDRLDELAEGIFAALSDGERDEAQALFTELEAAAPDARDTLMAKAALVADEDPVAALALIDDVYARWPDDPSVLLSRASYFLELLDDPEGARPLAEAAVLALREADDDDEAAQAFLAEAAVVLADCCLGLGDGEAAVEAAELAVAHAPDDLVAHLVLAVARFSLCDLDGAAAAAELVVDADADVADAHHLLGRIAQARGDRGASDRAFALAHGLAPERHALPFRVDAARFLELVRRAKVELAPVVQETLEGVDLRIEARPDLSELRDQVEPLPPDVPCLVEISALEESTEEEPAYSLDGVVLYQENLEILAADEEELQEMIVAALTQEIHGALGLDDEEEDDEGEG